MIFDVSQSTSLHPQDDYLSNSNTIYLEFIRPPNSISDYDESYHQFKLFFTRLTSKTSVGLNDDLSICPIEHLIDCDDSYCVHADARCNGINECRSKVDEESCISEISNARTIYDFSYFVINIRYIFILILMFML
ncbi:unnamed protein product [Rotaria socialis]|uniref:Uncharacterized protein n=1 Tax=Rotaria socialis TaxID=392032 RepID=A0A821NKT4_9BILA|nr:unnamed protein product [Rotaria socialis]